MDAGNSRFPDGLPCPVDVGGSCSGDGGDLATSDFPGYLTNGGEFSRGGDRKSRFNNVHAQYFQLPR